MQIKKTSIVTVTTNIRAVDYSFIRNSDSPKHINLVGGGSSVFLPADPAGARMFYEAYLRAIDNEPVGESGETAP